MSPTQVAILVGALALTGLMAWYFFGPKKSRLAELADGVQIVRVTVKGGYSPDVIQVATGVPVRLLFDRQESGDCSSRHCLSTSMEERAVRDDGEMALRELSYTLRI